jgi:hypothetical protein
MALATCQSTASPHTTYWYLRVPGKWTPVLVLPVVQDSESRFRIPPKPKINSRSLYSLSRERELSLIVCLVEGTSTGSVERYSLVLYLLSTCTSTSTGKNCACNLLRECSLWGVNKSCGENLGASYWAYITPSLCSISLEWKVPKSLYGTIVQYKSTYVCRSSSTYGCGCGTQ